MFETIKSYLMFALKVAIATMILNAILELVGGGVFASLLSKPIGTVKALLGKGPSA